MKRLLPVLLSILLVVSGMHLSVISHYCGGELAQTMVAFDRHADGCGMENGEEGTKHGIVLDSPDCCTNASVVYATDGFYQHSVSLFKSVKSVVHTVFYTPVNTLITHPNTKLQLLTQTHPPGLRPFGITPETLCVFRI